MKIPSRFSQQKSVADASAAIQASRAKGMAIKYKIVQGRDSMHQGIGFL